MNIKFYSFQHYMRILLILSFYLLLCSLYKNVIDHQVIDYRNLVYHLDFHKSKTVSISVLTQSVKDDDSYISSKISTISVRFCPQALLERLKVTTSVVRACAHFGQVKYANLKFSISITFFLLLAI